MKHIFFIFLLFINLSFAQDNVSSKSDNSGFFTDLSNEIKEMTDEILDSNVSDSLKLENLQSYMENLKFDDNFTKDEIEFNLIGHKKNFITFAYDKYDHIDTDAAGNSYLRDRLEGQFQISIKTPLYKNFLGTGGTLYGAYTQNSLWQVFDHDHSAPFRETNYMPEAFIDWDMDKVYGETHLKKIRLAVIHQSNGSDIPTSRSWNRYEGMVVFKLNDTYFGGNAWYRWDEDAKKSSTSTQGDDNPDLEDYIGKQKIFVKHMFNDDYSLELSHQNNIFDYDVSRGNTIVDLAMPSFNKNFDFIIRYYYGYGESLIDYNQKVNKISFGILLTDWI